MSTWPDWLRAILDAAASLPKSERSPIVSAAFKRWHEEKREAGICVGCESRATHGQFCLDHAVKQRAAVDRRAERLKEEGMCVTCGKPAGGGRRCRSCLDKANVSAREYVEAKKALRLCLRCKDELPKTERRQVCAGCAESTCATRVARDKDRVATGICVACGEKNDTRPGKWRCQPCLDKQTASRQKKAAKTIASAINLVAEREAEYFATGVKVVDAEYLEARDMVMRQSV